MIHLPKHGDETPVQFGVRITNQTSIPYRFELQRFLPELSDSHGRLMKVEGVNRNTSTETEESDIPLITPGQNLEFLVNAQFSWYSKDCLTLSGKAFYGGVWELYNFKSGTYQIRLNYENYLVKKKMFLSKGRMEVDSFWVGKVATNLAQLSLR
ncbi:hypothetical protein AB0757_12300 [Scytonema millei VB511283_2]